MKLFVIAALVAVAAAGRLEHLENSYLPPFGSNGGSGSPGSHGSFGPNSGAYGASGAGLHGHNAGSNFAGATSNQYLPPDHGPSANNGAPQFARSLQGFGGQQNYGNQQYAIPSTRYGVPVYQQFGQQAAATNRQYLAPHASSHSTSHQEPPQQAFDEQTGYHY